MYLTGHSPSDETVITHSHSLTCQLHGEMPRYATQHVLWINRQATLYIFNIFKSTVNGCTPLPFTNCNRWLSPHFRLARVLTLVSFATNRSRSFSGELLYIPASPYDKINRIVIHILQLSTGCQWISFTSPSSPFSLRLSSHKMLVCSTGLSEYVTAVGWITLGVSKCHDLR